jgi:hypothetical protein
LEHDGELKQKLTLKAKPNNVIVTKAAQATATRD